LLTLEIGFDADFADLFEIRGKSRAKRGRITKEHQSDASVALQYLGLDGAERLTRLEFDPVPARLDTKTALFNLSLAPAEGVRVAVRIACNNRREDEVGVGRRFYNSLRSARRALRTSSGRAASLDSSNSLFNEFARHSIADLYMLVTETDYGPYPFAGIP